MVNFTFKNVFVEDKNSPFHKKKIDIHLSNGVISPDQAANAKVFDCDGCIVSPGWVDIGVSVGDPGLEYKEDLHSLCNVAEFAGFTDLVIWPNTEPVIQKKGDIEYIKSKTSHKLAEIHTIASISKNALGEEFTDIMDLHLAGAVGFSDGVNPMFNSDLLVKTLLYVQPFGGLVINKPMDKWLSMYGQMHEGEQSTLLGLKGIPSLAEEIVISRDIDLLKYSGGRIHFSNISTKGAMERIKAAKKSGLNVTCDVSIAHLVYTDQQLADFDTNFKVMPPLRSESDRKALIEGVNNGVVDVICSGHRPQEEDAKKMEFDLAECGMNTLPSFFQLFSMLNGKISIEKLVECITINPRKILGLLESSIRIGEKANFTIFSENQSTELSYSQYPSKSFNNPLLGQTLKGKIIAVANNNQVKINENN